MGIALSLLLIAVGAITRFAITVNGHGSNVQTTGAILIIIGAILSIVYWATWGGFRYNGARPRTTVVHTERPVANGERPVAGRREVP